MLDVFFLDEYVKLNEPIEKGVFESFDFQCEFGEVQYKYLRRKIDIIYNEIQYYDIVSTYGYGGPVIIESKNTEKLLAAFFEEFSKYCRKNNIVSEFIRFHLFDNTEIREKFYGETIQISTNVIRNLLLTPDEIWRDFKPKVRKNVKRALSKNLKIDIDTTGANLSDFLKIYYSTMDRNNATNYYYFPKEYFEELNDKLKGQYAYFHVLLDNQIISTELVLYSDKYVYSFLGGTLSDYYDYRPNDFLKYEIIKWSQETKKQYFVLGGGYEENDGIFQYKRNFSPSESARFYIGKKIHNFEVYNHLFKICSQEANFDHNTNFFPAYRG